MLDIKDKMPNMLCGFYYFFEGLDDFLPLLPSNPARYIEKKKT